MSMRLFTPVLKVLLPLAVLGIAGLVAVTIIRSRPEVETQIPIIAPPGVRVHSVTLETVQISVASQGTIRPRTEIQVVPQIAGRVVWVSQSFAEGGFFEAGELLLRIDRFDYEQTVVSARSQLAQARLRLAQEEAEAEVAEREWEALGRGNPGELTLRKPQLEDARASVAAAEAGLLRAERDVERADVTAPYAGRVRTKSVDVGQFVTVGVPIATIYSVDVAEVSLPLPDEELAYLNLQLAHRESADEVGPTVMLRATFAGSAYEWEGRVVRTESEIDPVTRMVQVVVEVRDPYAAGPDPNRPPLAVGMYVEAEIQGREFRNIATVPRAALRGSNQVLVVDPENRIHLREIQILRTNRELVYVERGLAEGELVAVSALDSPFDGMLVQVTNLDVNQPIDASVRPAPTSPEPAAETPVVRSSPPIRAQQPEQPGWLRELLAEWLTRPSPLPQARTASVPDINSVEAVNPVFSAPPTEVTLANSVAVLPFIHMNRDDELAETGTMFADSVSIRLAEIDAVTVVPSVTEASWVVAGGVQTLGDVIRITARVLKGRNGDVVNAVKIDGTVADLPQIREEVAAAVHNSVLNALGIAEVGSVADTAPVGAVAVRPFANVSQMPEDSALPEMIVAAVTERLATLRSITVVAAERDATLIISGGIQRMGDLVRITARLIDVSLGSMVRAVKIDGPVDQLDRLRDEVASELVDSVLEVTS